MPSTIKTLLAAEQGAYINNTKYGKGYKPTTFLVAIILLTSACQSGPTREDRLAQFDSMEAAQLEATAEAEAIRQAELRAAAKLRREAAALNEQKKIAAQQGVWRYADHPSPVDGEPMCAIVSEPQTVMHDELSTTVQLIVTADTTFFRADATFNQNGFDTGIQVDGGLPIPFDRYLNEVTAVIDNTHDRLLTNLRNGSFLQINFDYQSAQSNQESLFLELPLDDIVDRLSLLETCNL